MFLRGLTSLARSRSPSVRHAHGFIKKNIFVEENAGLRVPGVYVYQTTITEMKGKDEHVGKPNRIYGTFLPGETELAKMDLKSESTVQVKPREEE